MITVSAYRVTRRRCDLLLGLVESLYHRNHFLSPADDIFRLLEQVIKDLGLVELLKEFSLEVLLRVVYERQRDGLWYHIDHLALDNVEVRVNEEF